MTRLFDHDLVYPSDDHGSYVELDGIVIGVEEKMYLEDDPQAVIDYLETRVFVDTKQGSFSGFTSNPPPVGARATIRIYQSGGGWYPDNRIVSWSIERE